MSNSDDWTGYLNNGTLAFGPDYSFALVGLTGWRDASTAPLGGVGQQQPRAQANGSYPVPHFMPSRVVTLQLKVKATVGDAFEQRLQQIEQATLPGAGDVDLGIYVNHVYTRVIGKVTNRIIPTGFEYLAGYTTAQIELTCADPRRLGDGIVAQTGLASATGGITWPVTWPAVWAATSVSGNASVTNTGTVNGPLTFRIYGPVTAPSITHVNTGAVLGFSTGLSIAAGDWVDIDCEARTVLYNGQVSRNAFLISRGWPVFIPGGNTYFFTAGSFSSAALLRVTATQAWL